VCENAVLENAVLHCMQSGKRNEMPLKLVFGFMGVLIKFFESKVEGQGHIAQA